MGCSVAAAGNPLPISDCFDWELQTGATDLVYYTSQPEDFTAFIDHTMTASTNGLSYSWPSQNLISRGIR